MILHGLLPAVLLGMAIAHAEIKVAVTVDDLPHHGPLPDGVSRQDIAKKMLKAFEKHHVPEVYGFINAGKYEETNVSYEVLKLWRDSGYPLGNHTYRHGDLNEVSLAEFKREIDQNEPLLAKLSAGLEWKYFRYPFLREGDSLKKRNAIRSYLKEKGYTIAQVTIDFEDWSWNAPYARCKKSGDLKTIAWLEETFLRNAGDMLERAEKASRGLFKKAISHVLLLHIGAFDAEMLDRLLSLYERAGVRFISLSQAGRDEIYSIDPALPARYGSEFIFQVMNSRGLSLQDIGLERYSGYPQRELSEACR